jgi:hypothetical protein
MMDTGDRQLRGRRLQAEVALIVLVIGAGTFGYALIEG